MLTERLCSGARCVVVGSAPCVDVNVVKPGDTIIGANGGVALAPFCQVFVTTSHLFRDDALPSELATVKSILSHKRHGSFSSCWVYEDMIPFHVVFKALSSAGISLGRIYTLNSSARSYTIKRVLNGCSPRVSTGVWCVLLALGSGAREVEVTGVSLITNEHVNVDDTLPAPPRDHVHEDAQALDQLLTLYPSRVIVTPELQAQVARVVRDSLANRQTDTKE